MLRRSARTRRAQPPDTPDAQPGNGAAVAPGCNPPPTESAGSAPAGPFVAPRREALPFMSADTPLVFMLLVPTRLLSPDRALGETVYTVLGRFERRDAALQAYALVKTALGAGGSRVSKKMFLLDALVSGNADDPFVSGVARAHPELLLRLL